MAATLRDFSMRATVLSLYRAYLRLLPAITDPGARAAARAAIRTEFGRFGRGVDAAVALPMATRRAALADGQRYLKLLSAQVGNLGSAAPPPAPAPSDHREIGAATAAAGAAAALGRAGAATAAANAAAVPTPAASGVARMTVEEQVAADVRGRVGVAWPWGSS